MNTRISSKLVAFAIALMMNSLIMGGVSYLFSNQAGEGQTGVAHTSELNAAIGSA
jgi:hypothetical protein